MIETGWAERVQAMVGTFRYPPTPDLAAEVARQLAAPRRRSARRRWATPPRRRLAWAAILLLLLAGLLAVPGVRATVLEWIRAGAINIRVLPPESGAKHQRLPGQPLVTGVQELATPVTDAAARAALGQPLQAPAALGDPDTILLHQGPRTTAVIMLWPDPDAPGEVGASLYQMTGQDFGFKSAASVEVTRVNGREAFWVSGPHRFELPGNREERYAFVTGNALIWWAGEATFRLEGSASLAQARQLAESLVTLEQ